MASKTIQLSTAAGRQLVNIKEQMNLAFLGLGLPTSLLLTISSIGGIFMKDFYSLETPAWQAQAIAQDLVDLVIICPLLFVSAVFATRNSRIFLFIFCGTNLFLIYTFAIYCFSINFNHFFLVYCFILGLAFYSFTYSLIRLSAAGFGKWFVTKLSRKWTGAFMIFIAVAFYGLWLKQIIPAIFHNTIPDALLETGLVTNPVHVLDLAIVLPGIVIAAVLLIKGKSIGIILAPVILSFFVLMNISIAALVVYVSVRDTPADFSTAIIMGVLAAISLAFLIQIFRQIHKQN